MKALVFNGPRDIRFEQYEDPKLGGPNDVILKVNRCSLCGSDLHIYNGKNIGKVDYTKLAERFCVGHEFSGEIVDVGNDVHQFSLGDKVFSSGIAGCGRCRACLSGNTSHCESSRVFGLSTKLNGGQAEYVNVPNADLALHLVPDGLNEEHAILLTDAMPTAYFGLARTGLVAGDAVAVIGLGPIGLIGVELAMLMGASVVYGVDPVEARRKRAQLLGAIALTPEAAYDTIREETSGLGIPRVFEACGARSAVELSVALAGQGSTLSFIGLPEQGTNLSLLRLLRRDVTVRAGVAAVPAQWAYLVPLLQQGRLCTAGLFTHYMTLEQGADAYRIFDSREDGVLKIMLSI